MSSDSVAPRSPMRRSVSADTMVPSFSVPRKHPQTKSICTPVAARDRSTDARADRLRRPAPAHRRPSRPQAGRLAVGHAILATAYYLLTRGTTDREVDRADRDERWHARMRQLALDQLAPLGDQ